MDDGLQKILGLLREEQERQKLPDYELEQRARLGSGTLSNVWSGRVTPTLKTIRKLAAALGVSLLALLALAEGSEEEYRNHQMMLLFRQLSPEQQRDVMDFARLWLNRSSQASETP